MKFAEVKKTEQLIKAWKEKVNLTKVEWFPFYRLKNSQVLLHWWLYLGSQSELILIFNVFSLHEADKSSEFSQFPSTVKTRQ